MHQQNKNIQECVSGGEKTKQQHIRGRRRTTIGQSDIKHVRQALERPPGRSTKQVDELEGVNMRLRKNIITALQFCHVEGKQQNKSKKKRIGKATCFVFFCFLMGLV